MSNEQNKRNIRANTISLGLVKNQMGIKVRKITNTKPVTSEWIIIKSSFMSTLDKNAFSLLGFHIENVYLFILCVSK